MKTGDKREDVQWLNIEREDPEAFGQTLAGKLNDLTGTTIGPGCNLHYNNVAIAYTHTYGFDMEGVGANAAAVTRSGNQGNIAELRVPEAASLLRKAFNVVVGPELAWGAVATTTDYASLGQSITTRNALDYFWRHEGFGAIAKKVQFESMAFAEGALHIPWDLALGAIESVDESDPENPRPVYSGGIAFRPISTWDIIRDPSAKSYDSQSWTIIREWPDKFDVAALVNTGDPERDGMVRQAVYSSGAQPPLGQAWMPFKWANWNLNSNRIPVYYLYCKRTPSVPAGRQAVFLEDGTVISDGPLDEAYVYQDGTCILPVVRTSSGEYRGTSWPYSKYFGILGGEQANDGLLRDLLTNATATSGNVLDVPEKMMDAGASVAFQTGGPQMIARPEGVTAKIEVLQLQQSRPEHFKLNQTIANKLQGIMGIDQLTAGNEIGASWSGALAALVTSTTVQNNSEEQASYTGFVQACGNVVLRHIQKHMKQPKRIALAGNARSSLVTTTEVSGTDVDGIERVIATIGSALEQTDAGKNEIAATALKEGWAKTPEDYQTVRDTGRLDGLTEDLSNELLLIRSENERLGDGEECIVTLTDDHRLHIKKHPAVTASVEARMSPEVVAAVQAHIDWHIRVLRETDPAILSAMGQEPLAPPMGGPPPPGGHAPTDKPQPPQDQQQAKAPSMPTDPKTGDKVGPAAGTVPPALAIKPN